MEMAVQRLIESMSRESKPTGGMGSPAGIRTRGPFAWPREYFLLLGAVLMIAGFALGFFYFGADLNDLRSYGYAGLFVINLIGSASILLPSPAGASVLGGGAFLDDLLGVPAFLWVGLVAGLGETVGELTGYAAGYGGRVIIRKRSEYERVRRWMQRRGFNHHVRTFRHSESSIRCCWSRRWGRPDAASALHLCDLARESDQGYLLGRSRQSGRGVLLELGLGVRAFGALTGYLVVAKLRDCNDSFVSS